jgi:hypothetical protein
MIREARIALHRPAVLDPGEQAGGTSGHRDTQGFECVQGRALRRRCHSIAGIQISMNVAHSLFLSSVASSSKDSWKLTLLLV